MLRRPELRGRPVVVGGDGDPTRPRQVVATASYEAREHGVRSGMPLRQARRLCPDAVFLPSDRAAYEEASARVMASLRRLPVRVEELGWDEAFLGTDAPDPHAAAGQAQRAVRADTGLSCAVGIGDNKLRAKTATAFAKPGGIAMLTVHTWLPVMGSRPTEALWGVGPRTAAKLAALGITTVAELAAGDPAMLAAAFGPTTGPWLGQLGRGQGGRHVRTDPWVPRSRSHETTFPADLTDPDDVRTQVARLARTVAVEALAEGRTVVRVAVKVRVAPFFTESKIMTVKPPTRDPAEVERAALTVLDRFPLRRPVRLLGVRAEFAMDVPTEEAPG